MFKGESGINNLSLKVVIELICNDCLHGLVGGGGGGEVDYKVRDQELVQI